MSLLALLLPAGPAAAWDFPGREIAERAQQYRVGAKGGQCKVFAQKVVNEVLAAHGIAARVTGYRTPGGAYFGAYARAGGVLVSHRGGAPGDLIQVVLARKRTSDRPPLRDRHGSMLHTAIIVRVLKPGTYVVRDSNWVAHERIGQHRWTPATWRRNGVEVYIWRFGRSPRPRLIATAYVGVGVWRRGPFLV